MDNLGKVTSRFANWQGRQGSIANLQVITIALRYRESHTYENGYSNKYKYNKRLHYNLLIFPAST